MDYCSFKSPRTIQDLLSDSKIVGTEITISGKKLLLKQGDSIIMPANKPHSEEAVIKFKMILTMIKS